MTYDDFKALVENLHAWRDDRRINALAQQEGLIANLLEEITEVARANTKSDKVGELCDIVVFAINAMEKTPRHDMFVSLMKAKNNSTAADVLSLISKNANSNLKLVSSFYLPEIVAAALGAIEREGYDALMAAKMTYKKISSRKGAYDESLKKWVKDTSTEAKAAWYEPNYDLCKKER